VSGSQGSTAPSTGQNDLQLIVNGTAWQGWQEVKVTRDCERVPASFDISATEKFPGLGQIDDVAISAGSPCTIKLGSDPVITGYVDRVVPTVDAGNHVLRIQGRSKLEDIVDCSVTDQQITGRTQAAADLMPIAKARELPVLQVQREIDRAVRRWHCVAPNGHSRNRRRKPMTTQKSMSKVRSHGTSGARMERGTVRRNQSWLGHEVGGTAPCHRKDDPH
jgi:hypothetical protein